MAECLNSYMMTVTVKLQQNSLENVSFYNYFSHFAEDVLYMYTKECFYIWQFTMRHILRMLASCMLAGFVHVYSGSSKKEKEKPGFSKGRT